MMLFFQVGNSLKKIYYHVGMLGCICMEKNVTWLVGIMGYVAFCKFYNIEEKLKIYCIK